MVYWLSGQNKPLIIQEGYWLLMFVSLLILPFQFYAIEEYIVVVRTP